MEWLYLIPAFILLVMTAFVFADDRTFKRIDKKMLQHHLDADPFKEYVQAKRELRANQHHDWNKEFGPPYWEEPDHYKRMDSDSLDLWFTDVQIRQLQRKRKQ